MRGTMKIQIRAFAQVKDILGTDSFLEYPDRTSVRELLDSLRQRSVNLKINCFPGMEIYTAI